MLETVLLVLATGAAGIVAFLIIYARWHYGSLERLGIPVIKPHFLLGSDPDLHKIVPQHKDVERFQKHGPVFGVYDGRSPRVFIVDPDMIRLIMVKDFDHFYDRTVIDYGHEIFDNILDFLPGEKWKTVRACLTPMFTTSRLRASGKQYTELVDKYMKKLRQEFNGDRLKFEMKDFMAPIFVEFTADYFLSIKLPEDTNIRENYIYKMVLESMGEGVDASIGFLIMTVYPFILKYIPMFSQDGIRKFLTTLDEVIKVRKAAKKDTSSGKDFIDVMVTMLDSLESPEYKRLGIEKITVQAQAFEMFVAGYDSILGTLSVLSYYMVQHPEVQDKILEELDESMDNVKDGVADLPYLTACIKEALRLSPSFHRLERQCMKEWTYNQNGINVTIPKGMSVVIPAWATNRNPDAFDEPEEFRPERFLKSGNTENTDKNSKAQFAFTSFGHGPHNCPGMRMGYEMVKAGMTKLLKDFRFEIRDDTKLELLPGMTMMTRYKPIYVDILKR